MENCNVAIEDHNYSRKRQMSSRLSERTKKPAAHRDCPCCRDNQHSATSLPRKRKRTSVARPSQPSPGPPEQRHLLRSKNGQLRPYTLELGHRIKTELWERLGRPSFTTSIGEDGLVTIEQRFGVDVHPPHYDVDISGEPQPGQPQKRARK